MAAAVLQVQTDPYTSPGRVCPLCFGSDHTMSKCALFTLELHKRLAEHQILSMPPISQSSLRPISNNRTHPYQSNESICQKYNRGLCNSHTCKYEHICNICHAPDHKTINCLKENTIAKNLKLQSGPQHTPTSK